MGTASNHAGPAWYPAMLMAAAFCVLASAAFAQEDSWLDGLKPMPTPRRLHAAAVFGGKIYTFGGCGSPCFEPPVHTSTFEETLVEVYNPKQDSWSQRKPIPAILFGAAAATFKNRIYLFGGFVTGNATYAYDPKNDAWQRRAPMPTSRHGMAAVTVGEKIYVVGGSTGAAASNALEVYDPENDRWDPLAPMPTARVFLAAAAVGEKIYAIGGSPDCCGKAVTNAVEVYDTEAKKWSSVAPLRVALQVSAAAEVNGKVYVLGGFIPGEGAQGSTFEYDPTDGELGSWTTLTPMPEPRDQAPAVVLDGKIHVLGGSVNCHCRALGTHSSYTPPPPPIRPPTADLQITNEIRSGELLLGELLPGQKVRYTITATNAGPDPVTGAMVTDGFPEKLTDVIWECKPSSSRASCAQGRMAGPIADRVNLRVGASVIYTVDGVLDREASGTLENTARIEPPGDVKDPRLKNNTSTVTRPIGECVEIEKTDGRDDVAPGGSVLYRVTVSNRCPVAISVTVTDNLAAGLQNVRWCRGQGCVPSISITNGLFQDDAVELPPEGAVTYQVAATVPCECELRSITNTACVELPGGSIACTSDTNRIVPEPGADLALDLTGPDLVDAGAAAPYTITVTNQGLCTARGVEIHGQFPEDSEILTVSGPCAQGSDGFPPDSGYRADRAPCQPGDILPGAKVEITVTLKAPAVFAPPASMTVSASVVSDCDPVAANNTASVNTAARCSIDLSITKSNGLDTATPGDAILYTIVVENRSECAVAGARVEDVFPPELEQLSWCQGLGCAPNLGGNLVDTLDLPAHGKETYIVEAVVSPMFAGTLSNTATVSPPQGVVDVDPENNSSTDTDEIVPAPGITAICKEILGLPFEGGQITYTFVLWNGGPEDQADNPGDEFVDALPPGLTLVSAVADTGMITLANPVRWNGAIPAGSMVTIRITAMIDGMVGQTICNQAMISFDADGDGVNESSGESSSCCIIVLSVDKIPVLTGPGAAVLMLLLALLALARMRKGAAV